MSTRTRFGLGLLGAALFLGVLGDALLRATPLGLNVLLWVAALVVVMVVVARALGARLAGTARWMIPVLLLFAALVMWRDSPFLVALNVLAMLLALTIVDALPTLALGDRADLWTALSNRSRKHADWRTWNWSRSRADNALSHLSLDP